MAPTCLSGMKPAVVPPTLMPTLLLQLAMLSVPVCQSRTVVFERPSRPWSPTASPPLMTIPFQLCYPNTLSLPHLHPLPSPLLPPPLLLPPFLPLLPSSPPLLLPLPSLYHPYLLPPLSLTLLSLPPLLLSPPPLFPSLQGLSLRLSSLPPRLCSWSHWPPGQSSQGRNPLPLPLLCQQSPSPPHPVLLSFEFWGCPTGCGSTPLWCLPPGLTEEVW